MNRYFSNSGDGDLWLDRWCNRCWNDRNEDCAYVVALYANEESPVFVRAGDSWRCTEFTPLNNKEQ